VLQKKTTCLPERGWGRWQMQNINFTDESCDDAEQRAAEQLAAQAAEVRALRLATAGALVQQRAAFLAHVEARAERITAEETSEFVHPLRPMMSTESVLKVARANTAVAQAREQLAQAKLEALQLAAEIVVRASAE
jgi:hypothetical protein